MAASRKGAAVSVALLLLLAGLVLVPSAAAVDQKAIYFVHGYEKDGGSDCNGWYTMKDRFRAWGHTGVKKAVQYYVNDTNCNSPIDHHGDHSRHFPSYTDQFGTVNGHSGGSHTTNTDIRHLGYHLAWDIYDHYTVNGQSVDVVAHSMGGLIIRYAIAGVGRFAGFPPSPLRVEDVVTLGTPHGGTRAHGCNVGFGCNIQTEQMNMNSKFLNNDSEPRGLQQIAWNPQGVGGTQWSTFGSDDDLVVAADRAAGSGRNETGGRGPGPPVDKYIGSCHKIWYAGESNVGHSDYKIDTQTALTATGWKRRCPSGWSGLRTNLPWGVLASFNAITSSDH